MQSMAKDIRVTFAKRVRELRLKEGLSVGEFAKKAGISRQHIRDLEMDVPQKRVTIVTLEKLAKGFNIPLWKLLKF